MRGTLAGFFIVFELAFGAQTLGAAPSLPSWFPMKGIFSINPDQLTEEDFASATFKIAKPNSEDVEDVEATGHHWSTSVYPEGSADTWTWDGEKAWNALSRQLEKQGFKTVYLRNEAGSVDATMRRDEGGVTSYVALTLTKDDAYSNSLEIVQTAPQARTLTLVPPAAQPEKFSDVQDFPYVTPVAGAKLLNTTTDPNPMDVTTSADKEMRLVGNATVSKLYEGPAKLSVLDFVTTYEKAFAAAGWTVVDKNANAGGGSIVAHYAKGGRDIWAKLWLEGADRWNIAVADVGSGLLAAAKTCKIELYGVNFDFNEATLRSESDSVLQQVLSLLHADATLKFEIGGHTDDVGKAAYNQDLSQRRADAVKAWFVAHGITADRLTTKGYGDTVPLVPNTSDVNRAKNRRVEMKKPGCQ